MTSLVLFRLQSVDLHIFTVKFLVTSKKIEYNNHQFNSITHLLYDLGKTASEIGNLHRIVLKVNGDKPR